MTRKIEIDLTPEKYEWLKSKGVKDVNVAKRYGVQTRWLRRWKQRNGVKAY